MILKQYYLGCLAHASYLVGDEAERRRRPSSIPSATSTQYLARRRSDSAARIGHVFLTHFHADFVAGHLELRDREGATIYLGARGRGRVRLSRRWATATRSSSGARAARGRSRRPGHSPESISILVYDLARTTGTRTPCSAATRCSSATSAAPTCAPRWAGPPRSSAALLYDSLHEKLLPLPDETLVYPGARRRLAVRQEHRTDTVSTIGVQRRYNYALQPMTKRGIRPPGHRRPARHPGLLHLRRHAQHARSVRRWTGRWRRSSGRSRSTRSLALGTRARSCSMSATRPTSPARMSPGASTSGSAAATRPGPGRSSTANGRIVIVADPGREQEAAMRLGRIGFDNVAGYLEGGMQAARRAAGPGVGDRAHHRRRRWPSSCATRPAAGARRADRARVARGRIDGSVNIPLDQLHERIDEIPRDRRWSSTARAATARRSRPASCAAPGSATSPTSSAGSRPGKRPNSTRRSRTSERRGAAPRARPRTGCGTAQCGRCRARRAGGRRVGRWPHSRRACTSPWGSWPLARRRSRVAGRSSPFAGAVAEAPS